jgi:20S proteasome alpha/beta subunit
MEVDDDDGPRYDRNRRRDYRRHRRDPPSLTVIEANGLSRRYAARAMGIGSDVANAELSRLWRRDMEHEEAVDMMRGIMRGIAMGGGEGGGEED